MKIWILTVKRLLVFLGAALFFLLAKKSLQPRKSLSGQTLRGQHTEYYTRPSSYSPPTQQGPCKAERLSESLARLNKIYDDITTFVMFLGYSTPIESLTAAALNAHPEILIPQQYDTIGNWKMFRDKHLQELGQQKYMLFFHLQYLSQYQSTFKNKANKPSQFWLWTYKGDIIPNIFLPDSWQESSKGKIKIIGDSSGVTTTMKLHVENDFAVLKELQTVVGVPVKFVHLISNPFDSIAVNLLRRFPSGVKINNTKEVRNAVQTFFGLVQTNEDIRKIYGDAVLDINTNDLKLRPRDTLKKICTFLSTKCDDSYVEEVENLFKPEILSNHRHSVMLKKEDNDLISTEMKKYSFFSRLAFDLKS